MKVTREEIVRAQKNLEHLQRQLQKESIYDKFKKKCKKKGRTIKSVLIELIRKWLEEG